MQGVKYAVDLVLCIDSTGSMSSIIERVKKSTLAFYDDISKAMDAQDKNIDKLRVRVIEFRDFYCDGERSLRESRFFELPQELDAFAEFVRGIGADGGGDAPECGMEALVFAMRSPWAAGDKRRHVIAMWTDTSAHPLEKDAGAKPAGYPLDMPADLNALTDLWDGQMGMSTAAKRLVIFAPDAYPWTDMATYWNNVVHHTSKAGEGLADFDYATILDTIVRSV